MFFIKIGYLNKKIFVEIFFFVPLQPQKKKIDFHTVYFLRTHSSVG